MHLDIYNTHMELYPYKKDDIPVIEDMYTATDKFTGNNFPCGYMIEDGKLFLPRGTSISKLENLTDARATIKRTSDPSANMNKQHYSLFEPKNDIQQESIDFLMSGGKQLGLNLATGFGKAEPVSRKIPTPTPTGYTLMGDIKPGDYVYGKNGKPVKVLQTFPQGEMDIYKIAFEDGRYALCTDQHLWMVKGATNKTYRKTSTRMIHLDFTSQKEYYERTNRLDEFRYGRVIPMCCPIENEGFGNIITIPWVLGVLISNNNLHRTILSIEADNNTIPIKIAALCGWETKYIGDSYKFFKDNKPVLTKDALKGIQDIIYDLKIPDRYLYNDYDTRLSVLQGMMDMSGDVLELCDDHFLKYQAPSGIIAKQFLTLLYSFGYTGTLHRHKNKYSVLFKFPNMWKVKVFSDSEKILNMMELWTHSDGKNYEQLEIVDVKIVGREDAQCIMVDSEDHLYLTDGYIVTHNTFCVAYASTKLNKKTLIITPNESLKSQWISTYHKMFDYRPSELMNIAGSQIMNGIMEDIIDPANVYFVNHQTLRSYMSSNNGYMLHKFFKKLNVGIKVYDESHLEFGNILLIDNFSNTEQTWYLTATFDRSDKTESMCFKRAFSSVAAYGEIESREMVDKHVIYHVVNINSHISPKDRARVIGFNGMSSVSYGKYAFFGDENQTAYRTIVEIINKIKNMEGKTLIFVPLIDAADDIVKKLKLEFPDKSISAYHSKLSKSEKEDAEKKDVIVSTIKSCGTGRDIPGLRCVICAEPMASKVIAQQVIGRLRPYDGGAKDTYYFDITDISIPPCNWWWKSRFKKIETLVKQVVYLSM